MIGDGWNDEPAVRPGAYDEPAAGRRRIAIVTGSRAEFGLLRPVMRAVQQRQGLELLVIAAGSHLVSPALTFYEVRKQFEVADSVPMQIAGKTSRAHDVQALGRGIARFGRSFERLSPDWIVVLGDRIEAFAAASAGSIGGFAVAHIHGGDRAEGVADEAMRHAITKLAHLHLAATEESAGRIRRLGERPESVQVVGSPAIDDLAMIPPLESAADEDLGRPDAVFLMHPIGRSSEREEQAAAAALEALLAWRAGARVLALHPNLDPGRAGIMEAIEGAAAREPGRVKVASHLPRDRFVGLLRRVAERRGVLVGNSSAALIECAALRVPAVDIGPRQAGRERTGNVVMAAGEQPEQVARAIAQAAQLDLTGLEHPYGDGRAGSRVAEILATTSPHDPKLLRKRNTF
jgi:UDP-hydrolysing UDP-N-acetyl-D-glucosamine 2-epimerase